MPVRRRSGSLAREPHHRGGHLAERAGRERDGGRNHPRRRGRGTAVRRRRGLAARLPHAARARQGRAGRDRQHRSRGGAGGPHNPSRSCRNSLFALAAGAIPWRSRSRPDLLVPSAKGVVEFEPFYDSCEPHELERLFREAGFSRGAGTSLLVAGRLLRSLLPRCSSPSGPTRRCCAASVCAASPPTPSSMQCGRTAVAGEGDEGVVKAEGVERLRGGEDRVGADAAPPYTLLTFNRHPLPSGAAVGILIAPGHLPDVLDALDGFHAQAVGPGIGLTLRGLLSRIVELRSLVPKLLAMLFGQPLIVAVELRSRFEFQSDSSSSR